MAIANSKKVATAPVLPFFVRKKKRRFTVFYLDPPHMLAGKKKVLTIVSRLKMGGMWGAKRGSIPITSMREEAHRWSEKAKKGSDQEFLWNIIYPLVKHSMLSHDSYFCTQFPNARPFPLQRLLLLLDDMKRPRCLSEHTTFFWGWVLFVHHNRRGREFVGAPCDMNNYCGECSSASQKEAPLACRGKPEWLYG